METQSETKKVAEDQIVRAVELERVRQLALEAPDSERLRKAEWAFRTNFGEQYAQVSLRTYESTTQSTCVANATNNGWGIFGFVPEVPVREFGFIFRIDPSRPDEVCVSFAETPERLQFSVPRGTKIVFTFRSSDDSPMKVQRELTIDVYNDPSEGRGAILRWRRR